LLSSELSVLDRLRILYCCGLLQVPFPNSKALCCCYLVAFMGPLLVAEILFI
jgi:hypothetical protein